jgi:hypothetical protein
MWCTIKVMLEHHIQRHVITLLAYRDAARFADLRPERVDSNTFTYHIKSLLRGGLIVKNENGLYGLTELGKRLGIDAQKNKYQDLEKAYSVVMVAIKSDDGYWLLRKRLHQPFIEKLGFIHSYPIAGKNVTDIASEEILETLGVRTSFAVAGSGYLSVLSAATMVSFLHYTVVYMSVPKKLELRIESDTRSEFVWVKQSGVTPKNSVPGLIDIMKALVVEQRPFFLEKTYEIKPL